jgi:hypothetical protein
MKEYEFQYTPMKDNLIAGLSIIGICLLTEFLGIYSKLNLIVTLILTLGAGFLLFKAFKRKVVHNCTAKLSDSSVVFEFLNETKTFNFNDLTSYKSYYGKNGPVLYLNSNVENFKIFANNNFCKTSDFKLFCDDIITQLDKYSNSHNFALIHEGSIFTKKGMLYFLIVATLAYLLSFFFVNNQLKIIIGLCFGFYFIIMWTKYYIENKNRKNKTAANIALALCRRTD